MVVMASCRLRGRRFNSRFGTFFPPPFFSFPVSLSPLSFSFMLAPPFQCSSIFLVCGYIFVSRAALQVVISDLFHLRLGASWGVISNHSYSLKVFIVFVALGVPFPQVHLWGGNTSCGISTGPASYNNYTWGEAQSLHSSISIVLRPATV